MAKIDIENLKLALQENNEWLKQYVYDVITNFSPTSMNVARILSHMSNRTIHITKEDREIWDSSYQRAVEYADSTFKGMSTIEFKEVDTLPTSNISKNAIYILKTKTENVYEQYIYTGEWKSLGKTSIDMDKYYTKDQIDEMISELRSTTRHTHLNMNILDETTAAYTREDQSTLNSLKDLDISGFESHIGNTQVHISAEEKQIITRISDDLIDTIVDHMEATDIHLSEDKVQEWDTMLEKANKYISDALQNYLGIAYLEPGQDPEDPKENVLYIRATQIPTVENHFDKYIYVGGRLEPLGSGGAGTPSDWVGIDFSQYVTQQYLISYVNTFKHEHGNKYILDMTSAAFTETLYNYILDARQHSMNNNAHVSAAEKEQIANIDDMIQNSINNLFNATDGEIDDIINGD